MQIVRQEILGESGHKVRSHGDGSTASCLHPKSVRQLPIAVVDLQSYKPVTMELLENISVRPNMN